MRFDYAVIGGGSAGRTAVETLVETVPGSFILLIDGEDCLPYKRTQVSKKASTRIVSEDFAILEASWYNSNGVVLETGCTVEKIDTVNHTILTSRGNFDYSKLLMATGAGPNRLNSGIPENRYSYLWSKVDAIRFRKQVVQFKRIAIVGNGVLGVEAAYQVRKLGLEAVLIGRSSLPMSRYLDEACSQELISVLVTNEVELMSGCGVLDVVSAGDGLLLHTSCGNVRADYVVLTVGSSPKTALAKASGLPVDTGILVNEDLSTQKESVWAAGDCAQHPDGTITGLWHSAENQGKLAALAMTGQTVINTNPSYRLKCEVFGGLWFSAGLVSVPGRTNNRETDEEWRFDSTLWCPKFQDGRLAALSGSAPYGQEKAYIKKAQNLVLEGADRETAYAALSDIRDGFDPVG